MIGCLGFALPCMSSESPYMSFFMYFQTWIFLPSPSVCSLVFYLDTLVFSLWRLLVSLLSKFAVQFCDYAFNDFFVHMQYF